jgi:[acyl-carrier-protein] S-malonyltransferase
MNGTAIQLAFVFPGQGSAYAGMAREIVDGCSEARAVFEEAASVLRLDLASLCFDDPEGLLSQTRWAQPAIVAASLACLAALRSGGYEAAIVGGHSLGEYTSLVAAGAVSLGDAMPLVRARGELMQAAADRRPSGMSAVLGLVDEQVVQACGDARAVGIVTAANFNAPGQVVISGELPALEAAEQLLRRQGARRVIRLPLGGGFHSEVMLEAAQGLEPLIAQTPIAWPAVPVVSNVTGQAVQDPEHLRELLVRQLLSPVQWTRSVETMQRVGAATFVEVGPGQALTNLLKRIAPEARGLHVEDGASLRKALSELSEEAVDDRALG